MPDGPDVKIDVVGVQIVADVARFARPAAKRIQLRFGLAHVGSEVAEIPQGANAVAGGNAEAADAAQAIDDAVGTLGLDLVIDLAGAVLTLAFIAGQVLAWDQLLENGFYAQENPAIAFFYLFTGLHAVHLLGGMWFLGRLGFSMNQENKREKARNSVTLCATYWHYLLLVWLLLFALMLRT